MDIGDHEIGEGWESMTCPYLDGFIVIWEVGQDLDPTVAFAEHMNRVHKIHFPDLNIWRIR
jgi:hypothetical protein